MGSGIQSCAHNLVRRESSWQQNFNFDLTTNSTSTSTILNHLTPPVTRRRTALASTVSAASHTSEMEKKRKHTLERAKADHVSGLFIISVILICNYLQQLLRQLQMRLQYARLKVEHGWVCLFSCNNFRV